MPKKIRKSIVTGQVALLVLGLFLFGLVIDAFLEQSSYYPSFWYVAYYYLSMPPLQVVLLGTFCVIGAVLLFPLARYEVKNDEVKKNLKDPTKKY